MEHLAQINEPNNPVNDSLPSLPELELIPFEKISKLQMNKALIYFDALSKFESALANASSETQEAWQNAKTFDREDAFLKEIAYKAHLTDLQLDFIFEIGITM
jgi:hypothetical protein